MTQNQISYVKYVEDQRHNKQTERQARAELKESSRHNLAYETETHRHNAISEQQNMEMINENYRHNLESEYNMRRGQNISESIAKMQARTSKYATDTNYASQILNSNTAKQVAKMNNQNSLNIARINSETSMRNAQLNADTNIKINKTNNATNKSIAKANRESNEYIQTNAQIAKLIGSLLGTGVKLATI